MRYDRFIGLLLGSSLIKRSSERRGIFSTHRMFSVTTRYWIFRNGERCLWEKEALVSLEHLYRLPRAAANGVPTFFTRSNNPAIAAPLSAPTLPAWGHRSIANARSCDRSLTEHKNENQRRIKICDANHCHSSIRDGNETLLCT